MLKDINEKQKLEKKCKIMKLQIILLSIVFIFSSLTFVVFAFTASMLMANASLIIALKQGAPLVIIFGAITVLSYKYAKKLFFKYDDVRRKYNAYNYIGR